MDVDIDVYYPETVYGDRVTYDIDDAIVPGEVVEDVSRAVEAVAPEGTPFGEDHEVGGASFVTQGNAAFSAGDYDEARRLYIRATLADERDAYAKLLYAVANFALGDYEVAAGALHRALLTAADLMEYPVDVRALYGDALLFESHLHALARYTEGHRADREARLLQGYLHFATGAPQRALDILTPLVEGDATDDVAAMLKDSVVRVIRGVEAGKK